MKIRIRLRTWSVIGRPALMELWLTLRGIYTTFESSHHKIAEKFLSVDQKNLGFRGNYYFVIFQRMQPARQST